MAGQRKRLYFETSFWKRLGDCMDDPRRRVSYRFLNKVRRTCRLVTSSVVHGEIRQTPDPAELSLLRRRLVELRILNVPVTPRIHALADELRRSGGWHRRQFADMLHVACAMLHSCDALVTWNLRDLAREKLREVVRQVARSRNLAAPVVGTPLEIARWLGLKIG